MCGDDPSKTGPAASIAAVTINWNAYDDTARLLSRLRELDDPRPITYLVDNASDDGSRERLQQAFPNINHIAMPCNAGFGAANNAALRDILSRDIPYAWLINNDACPEPDAHRCMLDVMTSESTIGAVGSTLYNDDDAQRIQAYAGGRIYRWLGYARLNTCPGKPLDFITGASMLLRCDALRQCGLFDERFHLYWEDTDLCRRLQNEDWKLRASDGRVIHKDSATTRRMPSRRAFHIMRSFTLYQRKHCRTPLCCSLAATCFQSFGKLCHGNVSAAIACWRGLHSGITCRINGDNTT
jgi:GT2 family glycosyltransferase